MRWENFINLICVEQWMPIVALKNTFLLDNFSSAKQMYFLIFVLEDANAVAILFHCFFDRPSTFKLFKSKKFPVDIYLIVGWVIRLNIFSGETKYLEVMMVNWVENLMPW